MRRTIVLWGGWWGKDTPLTPETINSHASVAAYFLREHLSAHYRIVPVVNFYRAEDILKEHDAAAVLSTFQAGFSRLARKGMMRVLGMLTRAMRGRLYSLIDDFYPGRYREDILFTVRPAVRSAVYYGNRLCNPGLRVCRMGWPAEARWCYPEKIERDTVSIFVDHGWYGKLHDCSREYFRAFREIRNYYPHLTFTVHHQDNTGITQWDLDDTYEPERYKRSNKVPYHEMLSYYRRAHIFCVTHPESAGLAAIEAAMSGAVLYVPRRFGRTYISRALLADGVRHRIVRPAHTSIMEALRADIAAGFDRTRARAGLIPGNTWEQAAQTISGVLEGVQTR